MKRNFVLPSLRLRCIFSPFSRDVVSRNPAQKNRPNYSQPEVLSFLAEENSALQVQ